MVPQHDQHQVVDRVAIVEPNPKSQMLLGKDGRKGFEAEGHYAASRRPPEQSDIQEGQVGRATGQSSRITLSVLHQGWPIKLYTENRRIGDAQQEMKHSELSRSSLAIFLVPLHFSSGLY